MPSPNRDPINPKIEHNQYHQLHIQIHKFQQQKQQIITKEVEIRDKHE